MKTEKLVLALVPVIIMLVSNRQYIAQSSDRPMGHGYHDMVNNSKAHRVVLFGGQTGDFFTHPEIFLSSETWAYDAVKNEWKLMNPMHHPPAVSAHAMAYDAESDKVILYGGVRVADNGKVILQQTTWIYNFETNTWKQTADGPGERYGHRMVYDAESDVIIMFGGACVDTLNKINNKALGDTWAYDFNNNSWKEMKPKVSPSARSYYGMVYDSKVDRVVLWGGASRDGVADSSNVWIYDYNNDMWTERKPGWSPPPRYYHAIAYDAVADKIIVYGGLTEGDDSMWGYDYNTNTWRFMNPPKKPEKLSRMPMVYIPDIGQTILFGGQLDKRQFSYSDETWLYSAASDLWTNVTIRQGEYLGQKKPGVIPEVFASGIVSTDAYEHGAPAFSPDGKEIYWSIFDEERFQQKILFMHQDDNQYWSSPMEATFNSGNYLDGNPVFSKDGKRIYFTSNRPFEETSKSREYYLWVWVVEKTDKGWSNAHPLKSSFDQVGLGCASSFSKMGTMFFSPWKGDSLISDDIYFSKFEHDKYGKPERLGAEINTEHYESYPFIAPDESYLIFEATRPDSYGKENLYISYRLRGGEWTKAINMGDKINSKESDRCPTVTPDGKYIFFMSNRLGNYDYYWVDAKIIDEFQPKDLKETLIK